jgi:hypothetical protein
MRNKLCLGLIVIAVLLFLGTAMAISVSSGSGGSSGGTSFSGNYKLDDSTAMGCSISLDSGSIFKETKAQGSGQNILDESVSTKENRVQNTIVSSGSMSTSSSSFGSSDGVVVNHDVNLAGDAGFIGIKSVSPINQMIVAGGFDGTGALNEHISSSSGKVASVGGTVSAAGVDLLNDEISQTLSSGENAMSIEGVSKSENGAIGNFGLAAVNQANRASKPNSPTGTTVGPNDLATIDSLGAGEIMTNGAYLGLSSSHSQLGGKIDSPLQLYLRNDANLAREKLDPLTTGRSIATAAATWEHSTSKDLFIGGNAGTTNVIVSSNAVADKGDGYSVHAFTPISGNAIAYARTWTSSGIVKESDVCYNTGYSWTTDWATSNTKNNLGQYLYVDVQSIALHELGHATGLGDLYLLDPASPGYNDWYQIMNSYNGPQRYLGAGDIAGLQGIYGLGS